MVFVSDFLCVFAKFLQKSLTCQKPCKIHTKPSSQGDGKLLQGVPRHWTPGDLAKSQAFMKSGT